MKLNGILMICFAALTFALQAQDKKYWSDQKLVLSDFEGSPAGAVPFQIKYDIVYSQKKQKIEKTMHSHLQARAIFIPSQSWIVHDSLQELRLKYCNVVFDFVELYARRFDNEINVTQNIENSKTETIRALNDAITQLASDTKMGTDSKRVDFWDRHIDSMLRMTYRKEIPNFKYAKLSASIAIGGGYNHLTGNLGKQFSSPVSVSSIYYVTWKRVMFTAALTYYGNSRPSQSYYSVEQEFGDSSTFKLTYNTVGVGYEIIKKPQFILTPYAGMSTMRFFLSEEESSLKNYTNPLKASVNVGLSVDIRSRAFYQNNYSQFRYGLCLRANYSPYEYLPKLNGNCLSFTLALGIYLDNVKNYL